MALTPKKARKKSGQPTGHNAGIKTSYRSHYLASYYTYKLLNETELGQDEIEDISHTTLARVIGKPVNPKKDVAFLPYINTLLTAKDKTPQLTKQFMTNVATLANSLQLDEVATQIIQFAAVISLNHGLFELIDSYGQFAMDSLSQFFATILEVDELQVEIALEAIWSTGLLTPLKYKHDEPLVLPRMISRKLAINHQVSIADILADILVKPPKTELTLAHFEHLDIELAHLYLMAALEMKEQGVNLLFYGAPGTGKTQLTRLLAQEMDADLFEVLPSGNELWSRKQEFETSETSGALRMQYNQLIQRLLGNTANTLLLIDECEDLFATLNGEDRISKEALHHLLETNALPTVWLTNHVEYLDESCLRRFKMIVEFPKPSTQSIKTLIDGRLKGLATSEDFRQQLACTKHLTMAHVDNAATVVRQVGLKRKSAEYHLSTLIESTLTASGYQQAIKYQGANAFDINYVNISGEFSDLTKLIEATQKYCSARTLLTGASGTGKTALVNYLAQTLDRELITVRCSDILSKYVGEAEQKVAHIFKTANDSGAMLFFDEVDSLLSARDGMQNNHEVQLVNELLTQIECFEQPLFAATNFHQRLDKAVLRRFDFKLHFAPLTTKQVLSMYRHIVGIKHIPKEITKQLSSLHHLTPGDFAIVSRRQEFSTKALTPQDIVSLLTAENKRKTPNKTIGFIGT